MCGIFCVFAPSRYCISEKLSVTYQAFSHYIARRGPDCTKTEICNTDDNIFLFASSVLWLQGSSITKQPVTNADSIFVYNGDIYSGVPETERKNYGDTKLIFKQLEQSTSISKALSTLHGPFAFIYLNRQSSILYFGRDVYGRRSLLIGKKEDSIILSSVAKADTGYRFIEVPAVGIFSLNLKTKTLSLAPWGYRNKNFAQKLTEMSEFLNVEVSVCQEVEHLYHLSFNEPDLTQSAVKYLIDNKVSNVKEILQTLCSDSKWLARIKYLETLLLGSISKRLYAQPEFCQNCIKTLSICTHAQVGVLFSGGIDCAVLALLASNYVDGNRPIDLLNVAFGKTDNFETPDRSTSLQTLEELRRLCPDRKWNLVEINVTQAELDHERKHHIKHLIYPLNSILDDSLGCALWFAARGRNETYSSPCRVLLVGMGADELFGGYTRHRAAYKNNGWKGVHDVLEEDWQNLPYRNLGRDDRVASDHGRQLRTPYLDEDVVSWVRSLQAWEKTYPVDNIPQGVGEKLLLRTLAYYLGLEKASILKKRALQFGSRIANSKENAHEISPRL